ncbi:MAG: hypothetical protein RSE13_16465 [Planktothrix sp. GU0601_MAG3]|nr:MAG: hypothetical protein RSE13_16465 [Planktothrix sp. GU0601_MAG3]
MRTQRISDIPGYQTLSPRLNPGLSQWSYQVKPQMFEPLEVHFSSLKTMILTRETLPLNYLSPAKFKARLSYLNLI